MMIVLFICAMINLILVVVGISRHQKYWQLLTWSALAVGAAGRILSSENIVFYLMIFLGSISAVLMLACMAHWAVNNKGKIPKVYNQE
jgi:hypothetical protein